MSRLEPPLKDRLRDPSDELALQRIWTAVDRRLSPRAARRRPLILLVSAAAIAGALALSVGHLRDPGPLRLADGSPLVATEASTAGAVLSVADGSHIQLGPGASFQPLDSSGSMFLGVVVRGSVTFDIRPGGPRRWQIECGLATVEVIGTQFRCDRTSERLLVAVQRGAVLVRGERVPERTRRLGAGEVLEIVEPRALTAPASPPTPAGVAAPSGPAAAAVAASPPSEELWATANDVVAPPARRVAGPAAPWRELARRGRHRDAFFALGAEGVRRESRRLGISDLFALADVARLSGHPEDAVLPLERIQTEFASDSQASLAAFALGRLELDALDRPDRAVGALNRALKLGLPHSLREDVRARLVEAYVRVGKPSAARAAAEAYRREFPGGRHLSRIERLTDPR